MNAISPEANDLLLFAQGDGELYEQQVQHVHKQLQRKWDKKQYKPELAVKSWERVLQGAAKKYVRDLRVDRAWDTVFPASVRREAAAMWEWECRDEMRFQDAQRQLCYRCGASLSDNCDCAPNDY